MIDLEMMANLLDALPAHARLVLLGDKDQLASVEAGAVMSQLCTGSLLKAQTVTLIHSHRFDAKSGIGQWARTVNADVADNTPALKALWNAAPDWLATLPLQQSIEGDSAEPDVTRLQLNNAEFGLALLSASNDASRNWTSFQATASSLSFVGIEGLTASASGIGVLSYAASGSFMIQVRVS